MEKVTVLYGHPTDTEVFEQYYKEQHLPLAAAMKGVAKIELTKLHVAPDGGKPGFYRMAEVYFTDAAQMQTTLGSAEGQATVADFGKFATGGVTVMIGSVD